MVQSWLEIQPAQPQGITIQEAMSHDGIEATRQSWISYINSWQIIRYCVSGFGRLPLIMSIYAKSTAGCPG